jgi:Z1 domain-containing protein
MQFLWGGPEPRPTPAGFVPRSSRWWQQYSKQLRVSRPALTELYRTSCDIVSLLPDPIAWKESARPFRGVVVGAVQSGKTSSMIGLSALALDQGFKIIVVLAGGKDDLRQQTARRFNGQLVHQRDPIPDSGGAFTLSPLVPDKPNGGIALPFSVDIHQWAPGFLKIRGSLAKNEPCVFVIKKHLASLAAMRVYLTRAYGEFGADSLPTLVLDDECDDASVEQEQAPIPEAIANLWRCSPTPAVAYVGYTATAAANLLQQPANELYPEHFVYMLRYPDSEETPLTFHEPNPENWYCGSECFYEAFAQDPGVVENFLISSSVAPHEPDGSVENNRSLVDAIRAYLVSGAYRLALQPGTDFDNASRLPAPHSMLIQTSPLVGEHGRILNGLAELFGGARQADGAFTINADRIQLDVERNPEGWRAWYEKFSQSRERLYLERPSPRSECLVTWDKILELLPAVATRVRIKAINSDPQLGQELDYSPRLMKDGSQQAPSDIYVIAVGGAKLSRGLTLEGLSISYFTRWTPNPTDDTILQISRWFGYRGSHLAFCRLFTTSAIHESLCEIHENDNDLRFQLAHLMAEHKTPRQAGLILKCNPRALPTSKIGSGRIFDLRFSPYQAVFAHLESSELAGQNELAALRFIGRVRARHCERVFTAQGSLRGEISRDWSAVEVADALDLFALSYHNPSLAGNPTAPFHRRPDETRPTRSALRFRSDPYQVAAYLREWVDQAQRGAANEPPKFDVGFARGQLTDDIQPFDYPLIDRVVTKEGKLIGQWTGRSSGWRGDALFDEPDARLLLARSTLRGRGLKGLLLLYVIHKTARGREGRGDIRRSHTPTFGISIPEGGPSLRRVTVIPG